MGKYQDALNAAGSKAAAARSLGIAVTTFKDRLDREKSGATPEIKNKPSTNKLNLYGISEISVPASSDFTRVLYFTDAHNQPCLSLDRFEWLAGLVNECKPDVILDGGDFDDFQSCCTHERDDTQKGKLKPSIAKDLEASAKARKLLHDLITHKCRKILCAGNHEARLWKYEDNNPAMYGMATNIYLDILKAFDWEYHPYGAYVNVAGVDFTHAPFNVMGKPVGGDTACKQIADKSLRDICWGHTHKKDEWNAAKFGSAQSVTCFNGGCFMPDKYIPQYSKDTRKEFWYGAHILTIADGRIKSIKSWHMSELQALYGR